MFSHTCYSTELILYQLDRDRLQVERSPPREDKGTDQHRQGIQHHYNEGSLRCCSSLGSMACHCICWKNTQLDHEHSMYRGLTRWQRSVYLSPREHPLVFSCNLTGERLRRPMSGPRLGQQFDRRECKCGTMKYASQSGRRCLGSNRSKSWRYLCKEAISLKLLRMCILMRESSSRRLSVELDPKTRVSSLRTKSSKEELQVFCR